MSLFAQVLRQVVAAPIGQRAVLRGSLVTVRWVPFRVVKDIDFCVDGEWTPDALRAQVGLVVGPLEATFTPLFPETPWPGWRVQLRDGGAALQVDFGQGDPLALPPVVAEVHGVTVPMVRPEVMLAWKIHGLVEFGPRGRWSPKTLADLVLLHRHAPLDDVGVRTCLDLAFSSRAMTFSALDEFLDDPTWGLSRGSRNKWKAYRKKSPWLTLELAPTIEEARGIVRWLVR
jgi:hypothetical protein